MTIKNNTRRRQIAGGCCFHGPYFRIGWLCTAPGPAGFTLTSCGAGKISAVTGGASEACERSALGESPGTGLLASGVPAGFAVSRAPDALPGSAWPLAPGAMPASAEPLAPDALPGSAWPPAPDALPEAACPPALDESPLLVDASEAGELGGWDESPLGEDEESAESDALGEPDGLSDGVTLFPPF